MKIIITLLAFTTMMVCADVIPPGSHSYNRCIKITNADSLGDTVLIYHENAYNCTSYVILPGNCLVTYYKYANHYVFWSWRDTVSSRTLKGFNYTGVNEPLFLVTTSINPGAGIAEDANPLIAEEDYYRLCDGFQLALWKRVSKFNDGSPDLTETFPIAAEKAVKSAVAKVELSFTESSLIYRLPSAEPIKLEFYDPSGKLAARLAGSGQENRITLPKLAAGNYFVKLKSSHYAASSAVTIRR